MAWSYLAYFVYQSKAMKDTKLDLLHVFPTDSPNNSTNFSLSQNKVTMAFKINFHP